jgi:hypothetical protein
VECLVIAGLIEFGHQAADRRNQCGLGKPDPQFPGLYRL